LIAWLVAVVVISGSGGSASVAVASAVWGSGTPLRNAWVVYNCSTNGVEGLRAWIFVAGLS
jgi:hypothetical protein